MAARDILQAAAGAEEKLYVDDVFSTYLYDGTGASQTITNGIDLAGPGGMVWAKVRNGTSSHALLDTVRGSGKYLESNATNAQTTDANTITSFNSNGFSVGTSLSTNTSIYTSWAFRKAPKFFDVQTKSHTTGTASTVDLSLLGTVGMVVVKRTDSTSNWLVWHRSLTAGNLLYLNLTNIQTADTTLSVSGTTATISSAVATGTYVVYAWAHDAATNGMVQCGGYSTDSSGNAIINIGFEPQFVLFKSRNSVTTGWVMADATRGWTVDPGFASMSANSASAESWNTSFCNITNNGYQVTGTAVSTQYIYLAIRIPNKPPTSGTEVFQPVTYTGTNTDNRLVNTGIKTDMAWFRMRTGSGTGYEGFVVGDRLRGQAWLKTAVAQAETTTADGLDQQIVSTTEYGTAFSSMTGVWVGNNTGALASSVNINANTTTNNHIVEAFKRAPGFFDVVCYTGTGAAMTVPHQLGVAPELMMIFCRSSTANVGAVYAATVGATGALKLATNEATTVSSAWFNDTAPTASTFTVGISNTTNGTSATHVAYLFATLPGISKVGSYTGNGGTQTIDCGFTSGARFVMIKRTDSTGDWYVFDTARGIVSGNDPHISTNGTAAEVATDDSIDPDNSGFVVNQLAATNINVTSATYIYLAIA